MTSSIYSFTKCERKAPGSSMELFSAFLSTLRRLISDERELCGYAGQDPAVDMWIRAAETSLDASKAACTGRVANVVEIAEQRAPGM